MADNSYAAGLTALCGWSRSLHAVRALRHADALLPLRHVPACHSGWRRGRGPTRGWLLARGCGPHPGHASHEPYRQRRSRQRTTDIRKKQQRQSSSLIFLSKLCPKVVGLSIPGTYGYPSFSPSINRMSKKTSASWLLPVHREDGRLAKLSCRRGHFSLFLKVVNQRVIKQRFVNLAIYAAYPMQLESLGHNARISRWQGG